MNRLCLTLMTTLLWSALAAQMKMVTGTVYYQETKEPVPFAYVKLKGIAYGTVTEFDGTFSLKVPAKYADAVLTFSYTGLKTKELSLHEYTKPLAVYLEADVTELYTVVVSAKREQNPKTILKQALKAIPDNYINEPFNIVGYYREYVQENGNPVKYADATFTLDLQPYTGKEEKRKKFESPDDLSGATTIGSWASRASSLHRWHFHQRVLKGEKAKITECKSSDDLNTTRLYSNVQGGPLSALTKDRLKYPKNFLTQFGKYEYHLTEIEKAGQAYYLINFEPATTPEKMGEKKRPFNYEYKLEGNILIAKKDLAIVEINYSVPPEYKQYICGYRGWSVRHFDFSVASKYAKKDGKYVLEYLKHADEFIVEDTASDRRVPYAAISEFFTHEVKVEDRVDVPKDENFANSDYNYLFDLPEGYNTAFWAKHELLHPESKVPEAIAVAMGKETSLIKQFANKLNRDTTLLPPVAPVAPTVTMVHKRPVVDNYAWLKDTENPLGNDKVMTYLSRENAYTNNYFKPLKPLQRELFKEVKSYIEEDFESLPRKEGGYQYFYKYRPQEEYPRYYRKELKEKASQELLFDINQMAADQSYYAFGGLKVSPGGMVVAFAENTKGNDQWVLKFKRLADGYIIPRKIDYVSSVEWLSDTTLLYTLAEQKTFRSSKVFHYHLTSGKSTLMYEELDRTFSVSISKSRSKRYIFLNAFASEQNEIHFLDIGNANAGFRVLCPRRPEHQYTVSHFEASFYILSNHKAPNYRLMEADTGRYEEKDWLEKIAEHEEVEIVSALPFKKWMVYEERHGLQRKIKVVNRLDGKEHYIKEGGSASIYLGENNDFDTDTLQVIKRDYHRPARVENYNMERKKFKLLKRQGKFSPVSFAKVKTVYAPAKDGTMIPITLIYNKRSIKNIQEKGQTPPLYITGYGAYGTSLSARYNPNISPLIQKGFVYAIAHVRGGGSLGKKWYQEGKKLKKKNSFTDFISCTEFLINEGYGEAGKVIAEGGSAGGLLMGAVANMRPDLYQLMILDVPFVDVVNTMLDDKLPLTTGEYEEWGNPNDKKYYRYIKSYSPYENVQETEYPYMLFITGINDSRVGYWEPAKLVAKLRQMNTSDNEILLKTDFSAGHGGASGRYASLSETAMKYSLILELANQLD